MTPFKPQSSLLKVCAGLAAMALLAGLVLVLRWRGVRVAWALILACEGAACQGWFGDCDFSSDGLLVLMVVMSIQPCPEQGFSRWDPLLSVTKSPGFTVSANNLIYSWQL